ncbi:uncharacterized protein LOC113773539 [Coffea eugenioides]|uniref:uncharacterized protein LOC113773539 n=1 Tax=Coffea eugenioides TaxID=49369 RepID=UPI000F6138FC|nr:uncharacterized protein LOC113773539 [Coffea eugenioides]
MPESRAKPSSSLASESERVYAHERTREGFYDSNRSPHHHPQDHHKETHGLRDDIEEETSISDVKAPNVFERAKEEIEAIVQAIHPRKEPQDTGNHGQDRHSAANVELKSEVSETHSEHDRKSPKFIERAKEDIEAFLHKKKPANHHHKDTHGASDDIDENTPISEIKGPNVFERAKEEVEALVHAIHPKKDSRTDTSSSKKEGGFRMSIGKGLEKMCSPRSHNKD